jgi:hypothetical protein
MNDLLTATFTIIFLIILAYLSMHSIKMYSNVFEGLENNSSTTSSTNSKSTSATGIAAGAASFADAIKSATTKINDTTLISKYRKDYENIVINAEECVNASMFSALIMSPLGPDGNVTVQTLTAIKNMNDSKVALNEIMKYIDSV